MFNNMDSVVLVIHLTFSLVIAIVNFVAGHNYSYIYLTDYRSSLFVLL